MVDIDPFALVCGEATAADAEELHPDIEQNFGAGVDVVYDESALLVQYDTPFMNPDVRQIRSDGVICEPGTMICGSGWLGGWSGVYVEPPPHAQQIYAAAKIGVSYWTQS